MLSVRRDAHLHQGEERRCSAIRGRPSEPQPDAMHVEGLYSDQEASSASGIESKYVIIPRM